MTPANIPGFYYDTEKGKYFKIQPDHVAPINSKYAKSNVKREQYETKKRKKHEQHETRLQQSTVLAARVLRHPLLGGAGLTREHGSWPHTSYATRSQDPAFVHGLEASITEYRTHGTTVVPRITDALYVPEGDATLLAASTGPNVQSLYYDRSSILTHGWPTLVDQRRLYDFTGEVSDLFHIADYPSMIAVACTPQPNASRGNVAIMPLPDDYRYNRVPTITISTGPSTERLNDTKFNRHSKLFAFASTNGVRIHDLRAEMRAITDFTTTTLSDALACEWLDPHTLAVGMSHSHPNSKQKYHDICLWDTRHAGVEERLLRKSRVNSLHSPDPSGTNLLVGSAHKISLYDLRVLRNVDFDDQAAMDQLRCKAPLLEINHISQSPRLDLASYNGSLLAAVNHHNRLQVYSLHTGREMRRLSIPLEHRNTGLMSRPRWQEDDRGAASLQVCAGNRLHKWSWQEHADEDGMHG